jgi:RHS repeat-associated protein
VSLLTRQATGIPEATYGYTPYGASDAALTKVDTDIDTPFNPYRYSTKRLDSGSRTYDMGVRRYDRSAQRFLQLDQFQGALDDLALATDPLTQNRYSLAASNPLSAIEWDGHVVVAPPSGGAAPSPTPSSGRIPICTLCFASAAAGGGNSQPSLPHRSIYCLSNLLACLGMASQLNDSVPSGRSNNWIWKRSLLDPCPGAVLGALALCGSMAPAAQGNNEQDNGNAGARPSGFGNWLADLLARTAGAAAEDASGSIFDRMVATQGPRAVGSVVPKSFNLTTASGEDVWVAPNATKHIREETPGLTFGRPIAERVRLSSLVQAVDAANISASGEIQVVNDWELIFSEPRMAGLNTVLKHAGYLGGF